MHGRTPGDSRAVQQIQVEIDSYNKHHGDITKQIETYSHIMKLIKENTEQNIIMQHLLDENPQKIIDILKQEQVQLQAKVKDLTLKLGENNEETIKLEQGLPRFNEKKSKIETKQKDLQTEITKLSGNTISVTNVPEIQQHIHELNKQEAMLTEKHRKDVTAKEKHIQDENARAQMEELEKFNEMLFSVADNIRQERQVLSKLEDFTHFIRPDESSVKQVKDKHNARNIQLESEFNMSDKSNSAQKLPHTANTQVECSI